MDTYVDFEALRELAKEDPDKKAKREKRMAINFYARYIQKKGNISILDLTECGYPEARATEMFVNFCGNPHKPDTETLIEKARGIAEAFIRMRPYDNDEEFDEIVDAINFLHETDLPHKKGDK